MTSGRRSACRKSRCHFKSFSAAVSARSRNPCAAFTLTQPLRTSGGAEITSPRNPFAWLLCRFAGLPRPGKDVPVSVSFRPDRRGGEYWSRLFTAHDGGERRYASTMLAGSDEDAGLLVERFWPFIYYHRLSPGPDGVAWRLVKWKLFGIKLPDWTLPNINCFEGAQGECYTFDIDVVFPLVGRVIHYRGWLLPTERLPRSS